MTNVAGLMTLALFVVFALSACASAPMDRYGRSSRQDDILYCVRGGTYTPDAAY